MPISLLRSRSGFIAVDSGGVSLVIQFVAGSAAMGILRLQIGMAGSMAGSAMKGISVRLSGHWSMYFKYFYNMLIESCTENQTGHDDSLCSNRRLHRPSVPLQSGAAFPLIKAGKAAGYYLTDLVRFLPRRCTAGSNFTIKARRTYGVSTSISSTCRPITTISNGR